MNLYSMPKRKADQNLNNKVECEERKRQKVYSRGTNKFSVHFDGTGIRSAVMRTIKDEGTKYVVGCVAWFSNKRILAELAKKRGVCVVVTKDKLTKTKTNQAAYKRLKPCYRGGTIRVVGAGRGRFGHSCTTSSSSDWMQPRTQMGHEWIVQHDTIRNDQSGKPYDYARFCNCRGLL